MHNLLLNPCTRASGPIGRLPAGLKLIATLAIILIVALPPRTNWWGCVIAGIVLIVVAIISLVPPMHLVKRLLFLEPFALAVAFLTLFQPGGWHVFLSVITRSTLSLFSVILFSSTTPISEVLSFLRRLHVPSLFLTTLVLTYRYLFLLIEESERLHRARRSRTFVVGRMRVWHLMADVIAQLFVRTSERAERVYAAMSARGWKT